MTRIYLPATEADLAALRDTGSLPVSGAYAVTDELRTELAENGGTADEELCEYVAFTSAAYGSLVRIAARPESAHRRVVVAADLPDAALRPGGPGLFEVDAPVPLKAVAAVHVDSDEPEVTRLVDEAVAELSGGGVAEATADSLDGHDLEWYAPSELSDLVDSLRPPA
ncbi:hypothetical protein AB0I28_27460 [Phytomonospora sp. NPDC050363]|uniref:DUF6912 family protein n=1 Tax=Phytomonospora sp. NPDC050363 TaxID=3155642 RepID=UPI0033C15DD4